MTIFDWFKREKPPEKEVEEQPNIKEARKQIERARVLIELDQVEQIARGTRRTRRNEH